MIHLFGGNTGEYIHLGSLGMTRKTGRGWFTWVFWIVMRHSYLNVNIRGHILPRNSKSVSFLNLPSGNSKMAGVSMCVRGNKEKPCTFCKLWNLHSKDFKTIPHWITSPSAPRLQHCAWAAAVLAVLKVTWSRLKARSSSPSSPSPSQGWTYEHYMPYAQPPNMRDLLRIIWLPPHSPTTC